MNRKDYGRRFPLKPIVKVEPVRAWEPFEWSLNRTFTQPWTGDPPYTGSYTVTYVGDPGATYTACGSGTTYLRAVS